MVYDALRIARYIIGRCNEKGRVISNLKLQKILYFVQAEFLVTKGPTSPCFNEEIEAWDFGPVVPVVYQQYKIYGGANIPASEKIISTKNIAEKDQNIINGIVDECVNYSASALVDITHHQTPWIQAYRKGSHNNVISKQSIFDFFVER